MLRVVLDVTFRFSTLQETGRAQHTAENENRAKL